MGASAGIYSRDVLEQAARTLDLPISLDISTAEINTQWKKLMGRVHPDVGGSNYFAEQLNGAREVLLDWIKNGRPAATTYAAPENQPREPAEPAPASQSRPPKAKKSKIGKILGWLIFLGLAARALSHLGASTDFAWHFSTKDADGAHMDAVFKNIPSSGGLQADLYCVSKPGDAGKVIALSVVDTNADATISQLQYSRSDNFSPEKAEMIEGREAVLHAVKVIDTMTQSEKMDQFGLSGVLLIAKWLLSQNSKAEISDDVKNAVINYYGPTLFRGKMHLIVTSRRQGGDGKYEGDVDLDYPADLALKAFGACNMRYPLIDGN